jgi:predicted enzyme related to lactoylglutathione lyase
MEFESIVPILYSSNVARSIAYYMNELAFDDKWEWDHPTTFGGVNKGCVRIFFCLKNQGHPGTWIAINMDNVDEYYDIIKSRGAKILSPPGDKEWYMREMLVEDPDGHIIRFGNGIE